MPPVRFLVLLVLLSLVLWGVALVLATSTPWSGMDRAAAAKASAPGAKPKLLGVARGDSAEFLFSSTDFIEEPDFIDDYAGMNSFFARQSALNRMLTGPVHLRWRRDEKDFLETIEPVPRPLSSLPPSFWLQLGFGSLAAWLGSWVWSLRPREHAARLLAISGLSFLIITWSAAIYSSRGLALEGGIFRALSTLNHLGVTLFGSALVALMMCYPRQLLPRHWGSAPFVLFGCWFLLDALRWAPDQNWGSRIPCLLQMLLATVFGFWQWRSVRNDPLGRAALRWVLLSILVGSGLFVFTVTSGALFFSRPLLPQGQALGFFLIMYAGLALGVGRYRLFHLDYYAYRVLLWTFGALMVLALDALLISGLGIAPQPALAVALLASGWIYFPLRQWLWARLVAPEYRLREQLEDVAAISLLPDEKARAAAWSALLRKLFRPARISDLPRTGRQACLMDDGLSLGVSGVIEGGSLKLELKDGGRSLFNPEDARLMDSLLALLDRLAMQQAEIVGAAHRERQRLADDLHDDLGSRLLVLMHRAGDSGLAEIARAAIADLRSLVMALDGPGCSLSEALANCRAEASERCEVAAVPLRWSQHHELPECPLSSRARSLFERALREVFTNALKHGDGSGISCDITLSRGVVGIRLCNRREAGVTPGRPGRGLSSLRRRLSELGGDLLLTFPDPTLVVASIEFPACETS